MHINRSRRLRPLITFAKFVTPLFLLCLLIYGYVSYKPFHIKEVRVSGDGIFASASDIKTMAESSSVNQSILLYDGNRMERLVLQNFLAVAEVSVKKIFPGTITIEYKERIPSALVYSEETKAFYYVDGTGFVLGIADKDSTNLPVIRYSSNVTVGRFLEGNAVSYYFDLIKALDENNISIVELTSHPSYMEFTTKDTVKVLFSSSTNPRSQAKVLAQMLTSFEAKGEKIRKIDLRFDKVIVEFIKVEDRTD